MNNIRYNPLFGTGDASSDVVNPVFGVARSNPLFGIARSNGSYPEDIEIQGLSAAWDALVAANGISHEQALDLYNNLDFVNQAKVRAQLQVTTDYMVQQEEDEMSGISSPMRDAIDSSLRSAMQTLSKGEQGVQDEVSSEKEFDLIDELEAEERAEREAVSEGSGVLIDQPPHPSAGGEFGVPDFGYGEYQGVAEAGYGEGTPADFQGGLEAAWDVLAGSGISADEYEDMDGFIKSDILAYAMMYVESNGADLYAAEAMMNVAFSGLASDDIEDFFEEEVKSSSIDRDAVLTEAFANVFPFESVSDHAIYPYLMETLKQIEMATGIAPSVECVTNGLNVFRNVGFTSYNPEMLSSILAITCSQSIDPNQLITDALITDDFCSDSRVINTLYYFGKEAEQAFAEYCSLSPSVRADELALADFDIAQLLGLNGSDLDAFVLASLDGKAPEGNLDNFDDVVVEDIQQAVAPKVKSPAPKVTVTASDKNKTPGLQEGRGKIHGGKVLAFSAIGISALALGFFANKLRKL